MKRSIVIPVAVIGIVIIITIGAGVMISAHKKSTASASSSPSIAADTSTSASPAATATSGSTPAAASGSTSAASKYKDGTYSANGSYSSPGGNDTIGVSITVKSDVITAVAVTPGGSDRESQDYEQRFASGISQIVVGKPLASSFDVSQVNGSSLTGTGFASALQSIRAKASA